jgi:hypothetical protein
MPSTAYRYPTRVKVVKIFCVLLEAIFIFAFFSLLWSDISAPTPLPQKLIKIVGTLCWTSLGLILLQYIASSFSEIRIDSDAIYLEFLWLWLKIPWSDVISIKATKSQYIPRRGIPQHIIRVKTLTSFHHLYGLMYLTTSTPCFLINGYLNDYSQVVREIRSHLANR